MSSATTHWHNHRGHRTNVDNIEIEKQMSSVDAPGNATSSGANFHARSNLGDCRIIDREFYNFHMCIYKAEDHV